MRNIRQNLFFTFIYNMLGVQIAAGNLVLRFSQVRTGFPTCPGRPWISG